MPAPTLISYTETAWNTATTPKSTGAVSWQSGDILVYLTASEGAHLPGLPTSPAALTFTPQQITNNNGCFGQIATCIAASSGSDIFTAALAGGGEWGFAVWVFRGSTGVGHSTKSSLGGSAANESTSLTSLQADSAIVWGCFDFNAATVGSIVPTPTNTRQLARFPSHYTIYVADLLDQVLTTGVLYGCSGAGSTTGPFSILVLEVLGNVTAAAEDDSWNPPISNAPDSSTTVWQ